MKSLTSLLILAPCFLLGTTGYITNYGSTTVSVIDLKTNTVTGVYEVGNGPAGIAINGDYVYVANSSGNTVSVINTITDEIASITVDYGPSYIAIDGPYAYVVNSQGATMSSDGSVSIIDTRNNTFVTTIYDASFNGPAAIAFREGYGYVANFGAGLSGSGNTVSVIDLTSRTVTAVTPPFTLPSEGLNDIAIQGIYAYTTNYWSPGNVSIVDTTENVEAGTIDDADSFNSPTAIAISNGIAYVTNGGGNTVSVVDLLAQSVTNTITVGYGPADVSIYGSSAYVTNFDDNSVSIIDTATGSVSFVSDPDATFSAPNYIALPPTPSSRAFGRPNNCRF